MNYIESFKYQFFRQLSFLYRVQVASLTFNRIKYYLYVYQGNYYCTSSQLKFKKVLAQHEAFREILPEIKHLIKGNILMIGYCHFNLIKELSAYDIKNITISDERALLMRFMARVFKQFKTINLKLEINNAENYLLTTNTNYQVLIVDLESLLTQTINLFNEEIIELLLDHCKRGTLIVYAKTQAIGELLVYEKLKNYFNNKQFLLTNTYHLTGEYDMLVVENRKY